MFKNKLLLIFIYLECFNLIFTVNTYAAPSNYTVISDNITAQTQYSNNQVESYYHNQPNTNNIINYTVSFFTKNNIPYALAGAIGEGDTNKYCLTNYKNTTNCLPIKQDPIFTLTKLDCTTLVQDFLALLYSNNLSSFKQNLINISYGAFNNKAPIRVSYLNRNNFTSSDFFRVNQQSGKIKDITNTGFFKNNKLVKTISGTINHRRWFATQALASNIKNSIRILPKNQKYAKEIITKFQNNYGKDFKNIKISLNYIPKEAFVKKVHKNYILNTKALEALPNLAVISFVRDDKKWLIGDNPISQIIGSDILISHMAILYKQQFRNSELIYQNITCNKNALACQVKPVICTAVVCNEAMMLVATSAYPNNYLYSYNRKTNTYACTAKVAIPKGNKTLTTCNRVLAIPLGNYLLSKTNGTYPYINSPSLLGINVQKINFTL